MKVKLDENVPIEVAELLTAHGHDTHTVAGESLAGREDAIIFQAAIAEGRLLITQDMDFSDVRSFKPGTHSGVVLIRVRDPSRRRLIERMRQVLRCESLESWARCFVVIGDRKLRVRRP